MSTLPPTPPERQSLYPEPHRAGDWTAAPPVRRRAWLRPVLIAAGALAVVSGATILGLNVGHSRGTASPVLTGADGTEINAIQAEPGTCLSALPEDGVVARASAVSCDSPHHAEVVLSVPVSGDTWPGRDAVAERVLARCGEFIQPGFADDAMFKPGDWQDGLRWVAWLPTERSWAGDERSGVCVAYRDGDILGSFVAGTAAFTN